ncbi:MAG: hypothetical protein JXM70_21235 [Pirellulales bacterium]|nr:hypothetical protein [Pirellulales bacterium]
MNSPDAKQPDDAVKTLNAETIIERFTPPRLSIALLLIWTAVTAVVLKLVLASDLSKWMIQFPQDAAQSARMAHLIINTLIIVMLSAGLVGSGIIILAKIRGAKGRLQPGHWLLIAYTLSNVIQMGYTQVIMYLTQLNQKVGSGSVDLKTISWLAMAISLFNLIVPTAIWLWAAFRSKGGWHWTTALCLLPVTKFVMAGLRIVLARLFSPQSFVLISSLISFAVNIPIIIAAVSVDLFKGERRDWLHWTGIGIVGMSILLRMFLYLLYYLFIQ